MKKVVLALGYIPKQKGGLQTSGLSLGIFDLHNSVNSLNTDIEVVIAATDIFVPEKIIENTRVLGWSKKALVGHAIKRFYRIPFFIYTIVLLWLKYRMPIVSTLSKVVFFDDAIERVKPDIIHFHGAGYAFYIKALWRNHRPVVLRLHGMNGHNETIPHYMIHRKMERDLTLLPFNLVTFISEKNRIDWLNYYGAFSCDTAVILNGYNERLFYIPNEPQEKRYDLLTIASVCDNKGQKRVLEALKRLKEDNISLKYLIIGACDVEYKKELVSYINKYNINAEILSFCNQDELIKYLWASHYFILPSVAEGLGKVFFESLACGVPVILPKDLPIVYEKDIINSDNALLLDDYTSNSIYEVLKNWYNLSAKIDADKVACSVSSYKWQSIAKIYVAQYKNIIK